ncbi:MAG: NADH-quinone oxidoreductase subunit K [Bacteroidota bacterium]|nr:NADH-quinone oxidoreductase subunit K [Bacteroidota bacterium]
MITLEYITLGTGILLMLMGIWGLFTQKNLLKIVISFTLVDTGIHILMVSIGHVKNRTAPIIDDAVNASEVADKVVDPIPQALVLTSIVIGLGVTALMLTFVVKMAKDNNSLNVSNFKSLKW